MFTNGWQFLIHPLSMGEVGGYVKLHRSFLDWEWYDDDDCVKLFLHLLMIANWQETKWHGQSLPAGSRIISQVELAARFGWSRQKMGRTLDKLKSTGEVICKAGAKWTLVTLVNWAKYQSEDQQTGHQAGTNRAPSGHEPGTNRAQNKKGRREEGKKVDTLFADSRFVSLDEVTASLPELVAEGVDLVHYRDAIRNWSDTKEVKRTDRGWLATFRQWAKTDRDSNKLKLVRQVSTGWNPRA